jgi:hypothetical protein
MCRSKPRIYPAAFRILSNRRIRKKAGWRDCQCWLASVDGPLIAVAAMSAIGASHHHRARLSAAALSVDILPLYWIDPHESEQLAKMIEHAHQQSHEPVMPCELRKRKSYCV